GEPLLAAVGHSRGGGWSSLRHAVGTWSADGPRDDVCGHLAHFYAVRRSTGCGPPQTRRHRIDPFTNRDSAILVCTDVPDIARSTA
ncbi:MAG TPA: hypothetical protein VII98_06950, partial [Solirubrobacteraceae bacterium]